MKKSIKWIIPGVVIVVVVAIYAYTEMQSGMPVRTAKVGKGDIRAWVEDRAMTTLPLVHKITMPQDGRILPITLAAGNPVSKGQVVAQMDTADLQSNLDLADAEVKRIEAQIAVNAYDKIENTALLESEKMIKALNATGKASNELVRTNQAELKYAQWLVEMEEKLVKQRASSKEKLQRAQRDFGQAESQVASSRFMSSATWAIAAVVELLPRYVKELLGRKHLEGDVLKQGLAGARAGREMAARRLQRATMTSPVDGMVLRRLVKNEAYLQAGTLLLEIGEMNKLQVTANILSQDVVSVRPGNGVDIYGPSIGDSPIRGTVLKVKPAGFTKVSSLGVDQQRVPVVISFDRDALESLNRKDCAWVGIPGPGKDLHGREKECADGSPHRLVQGCRRSMAGLHCEERQGRPGSRDPGDLKRPKCGDQKRPRSGRCYYRGPAQGPAKRRSGDDFMTG